MNGRLMASPTTPLPLTRSSSCPRWSERTVLSLPTSAGRTMPRTVMVWRSELTSTSLVASTSMAPLGSTAETRAVSVVVITTPRLVEPWPLSCVLPVTPARLAHGPVALVMPARALIEFAVLELRPVFVVPETTAEAFSTTRMVIMSSIWLALRSRAASARREPGAQIPPEAAGGGSAGRARASDAERSPADCEVGAAFFLAANVLPAIQAIDRTKIGSFIDFPLSPQLCLWIRHGLESAVGRRGSISGWYRRWHRKLRRRIPVRAALHRGRPLRAPPRRAARLYIGPTD